MLKYSEFMISLLTLFCRDGRQRPSKNVMSLFIQRYSLSFHLGSGHAMAEKSFSYMLMNGEATTHFGRYILNLSVYTCLSSEAMPLNLSINITDNARLKFDSF